MMDDVIIVLGHGMDRHGVPDYETQKRLNKAYEIYRDGGFVQKILLSGWAYRSDVKISLAQAMAKYLNHHCDVPILQTLISSDARDTVGDAYFSKIKIQTLGKNKRICVVTSDYHQERAQLIFNFIYGKSFKITLVQIHFLESSMDVKIKSEHISLQMFQKTFSGINAGDDNAIFSRLCSKHPYYNGDIHPQI